MRTNSGTRRRKRKFPLLFVNCDRGRIEIDHLYGLRCRGWYCNLEQHSLCRPSRGRAGRHNSCCSRLQYQPLRRRPYRGQFNNHHHNHHNNHHHPPPPPHHPTKKKKKKPHQKKRTKKKKKKSTKKTPLVLILEYFGRKCQDQGC